MSSEVITTCSHSSTCAGTRGRIRSSQCRRPRTCTAGPATCTCTPSLAQFAGSVSESRNATISWGNRYFFSENLYQSVSFIDVSLYGAIQVLRNADPWGWRCVRWSRKKRYEGVRFKVIQRYEGVGGGIQFPGKKRYVTLEWPLSRHFSRDSYRGEIATSRNKN